MMNLTPEEKAIGRENFHAVIGETRRDFLKNSIAAGIVTGASVGAMYYGYESKMGDPLRVGIIGTGDEGNVLIGALSPNYVQVVAIADIRPYNIYRAFHGDYASSKALKFRPGLMAKYGWRTEDEARKHVDVYSDRYEDLLDDANIEAVIIALPLHLHHEAAIKAMRKGKHVLTEKLMGHSVAQCKEMARVAKQTDLHLATGHQRHYSVLYDNAVDTIKRGLLGDVHYIRAQWHRGNLPGHDSWSQPLPPPVGTDLNSAQAKGMYSLVRKLHSWRGKLAKATGKDIDLWQKRVAQIEMQIEDQVVQAEDYGYDKITLQDGKGTERSALEELIRWRLWNRTGGGLMAELGSHQLDAASIFISAQHEDTDHVMPLSVSAVGGRHIFPLDRDADDHVYCTYEFPGKGYYKDYEKHEIDDPNKKICVTYSSINGNGFGGYGETVMGTHGTMILEREQEVMLYKNASTSTRVKVKDTKSGPTLDTTDTGPASAVAVGQHALTEVSRGYTEEIEHWAWCVRNPDPANVPLCPPAVALADAVIALTSNLAMKNERKITFKPEWFAVDSDETPDGEKPRQADQIT